MKVYMARYHNGASWGDYSEWYGDKVYINKQDCAKEIERLGYVLNHYNAYELKDRSNSEFAKILEFDLVG